MNKTVSFKCFALGVLFFIFVDLPLSSKRRKFSEAAIINMAANLTCIISHGAIAKNFTWRERETKKTDIVVFQSSPNTSVSCNFKEKQPVVPEFVLDLLNSTTHSLSRERNASLWTKLSQKSENALFSFEQQFSTMKVGVSYCFKLWIAVSSSRQLLFEGSLVRLGHLPSFSDIAANHISLASFYHKAKWKLYKNHCNQDLVIVLPRNPSYFKKGDAKIQTSFLT